MADYCAKGEQKSMRLRKILIIEGMEAPSSYQAEDEAARLVLLRVGTLYLLPLLLKPDLLSAIVARARPGALTARAWVEKRWRALLMAAVTSYFASWSQRSGWKALPENEVQASLEAKNEAEPTVPILYQQFESVRRIADSTTLPSILPLLKSRLSQLVKRPDMACWMFDIGDGSAEEVLWHGLKYFCFTRTLSAIWAVSLLDLFIRTQLNILGRHVHRLGHKHKFIAFAHYLPEKGLSSLVAHVQEAVKLVLKDKHRMDLLDFGELGALFMGCLDIIESTTTANGIEYLVPLNDKLRVDLPAASLESDDDDAWFAELLKETRAVLSSPDFWRTHRWTVNAMFNEIFRVGYAADPHGGVSLSKLLGPIYHLGNKVFTSEYTQLLSGQQAVQFFCARVYGIREVFPYTRR